MSKIKKISEYLKEKGITMDEATRLGIVPVILECKKREAELEIIERQNEALVLELERATSAIKKELQTMTDNALRLKAMVEFEIKGRTFDA